VDFLSGPMLSLLYNQMYNQVEVDLRGASADGKQATFIPATGSVLTQHELLVLRLRLVQAKPRTCNAAISNEGVRRIYNVAARPDAQVTALAVSREPLNVKCEMTVG
jgi:hypothetical protein